MKLSAVATGTSFTWKGTKFHKVTLSNLKVPPRVHLFVFKLTPKSKQHLHDAFYFSPPEARRWKFPKSAVPGIFLKLDGWSNQKQWLGVILHEIGHHLFWIQHRSKSDDEEAIVDNLGAKWYLKVTEKQVSVRNKRGNRMAKGSLTLCG